MNAQENDSGQVDRRYQEGLAHLQAGEWQSAIACFEELKHDHPDNSAVEHALQEAQFRADLDETAQIKAKRWTIPWRLAVVRTSIVLLLAILVVAGWRIFQHQVAPAMARSQEVQRQEQLVAEGSALLRAGNPAEAEVRYKEILAIEPGNPQALAGLQQIAAEQELEVLYQQAVNIQEAGDQKAALDLLIQIRDRQPLFRDVSLRIEEAKRQLEQDDLFAAAEADYWSGRYAEAMLKYGQLSQRFASYKSDLVADRLVALNVQIGRDLIEQDPPEADRIHQALDFFAQALTIDPRSTEAELEERLALSFLEGQDRFQEALWEQAIDRLRAVYDVRPTYHCGTAANRLYTAYIQSGDQHRDAGDYYFAYEGYRQAASLLVEDTSLAQGRLSDVMLQLTPTPMPTHTPTPAPTPTPTPSPTAKPKAKPKPKATKEPTSAPVVAQAPEFPWTGGVGYTLSNCGVTQLKGFTLDRGNRLVGDVWLYYWWEDHEGDWTQSEWTDPGTNTSYEGDERNWEFAIDGYAKAGVWYVCVVPFYGQKDCISNIMAAATSSDCVDGIQIVHMVFRQS